MLENHACIHPEEDCKRYADLLEKYPWTRRYWNYNGKPFEEICGWFDPRLTCGEYPGWSRIFEKLCENIQQILDKYSIPSEQFVIRQVKEKFARVRMYWGFYESNAAGFPEKEIGRSGIAIDFLGHGTLSGFGSKSAEEDGYDPKYDEARIEIEKLLKEVAEESYITCIMCGSVEEIGYTKGWVLPVCAKCSESGLTNRVEYLKRFRTIWK